MYFTKSSRRNMFEPEYDRVYGSSIFTFSEKKQALFLANFPGAIVGGTGFDNGITVEKLINKAVYEKYDYDIYPDFEHSLGFSQRGCRLKCKFCVVSKKEGKNVHSNWIDEIYRGEPYPKNLLLLDNDFFGQPDWKEKSQQIIDGGYKVSFNQGINIRLIDDQAAETLPEIKYYDPKFKARRLYTAWDNLGDEKVFLKGAEKLAKNGIPMNHLMVYMLIGFKKNETWDDIFHRFKVLTDLGCLPYPMVYNNKDRELKKFQRWVIMRHYQFIPWEEYNVSVRYVGGSSKNFDQTSLFD